MLKTSKIFLDPNLILAVSSMSKYKSKNVRTNFNKPYVLKAAEKIYFNVCKIKDENLLDNEKAIEIFY